ncbi:hypothetical protein [Mitsuokella jalaludinii]|uniref:hypothetical protein n=1 Tax=Mitsuokella jalaludinii TaxID=187979 RepID=UPI0020D1C820|nr:hypothetical protein [Mitsuokella jalaludinii]MCQ1532822.1 hypothetical protein [Mitsuokella jalaludinii]
MKIYTEQDLPMPVLHDRHQTYDANTSVRTWFQKLQEEVMEAHEKAVYYQLAGEDDEERRAGLAEELTDVKTVCETYLHALGYDDRERAAIQRRVNAKNKRRGYLVPMEMQAKGGDDR